MAVAIVSRRWSKVDHLGVWAYDRVSTERWQTGRYVPICSSERNHSGGWPIVHHLSFDGDQSLTGKPLCTRCRRLLTELNTLTDLETPGVPR